jgi:hypothetical protein
MLGIRRFPSLFRMRVVTDGPGDLSAWSIAERVPLRGPAAAEPAVTPEECTCGLAVAGQVGAYNEEAFQYLLAVERKRSERSNRPFVLVLIEPESRARPMHQMDPAVGAKVLAGLARALRETDVIGWYREGRVVGAMLTHLGDSPMADVSRLMSSRVQQTLRDSLPEHVAQHLQVKLYQPFDTLQS